MKSNYGDEANTNMLSYCNCNEDDPKCNRYEDLPSWHVINRSYEPKDMNLYSMTFKPFNKTYDPTFNAIDHIKKKIKSKCEVECLVITREILATKVHYHAMLFTKNNLMGPLLNGKQTNKFRITCKVANYFDKFQIHEYIIKEIHQRCFKPDLDIYVELCIHSVLSPSTIWVPKYHYPNLVNVLYDKIKTCL